MSIISVQGNLLDQGDADALVNTVNCVGTMGKGLALDFKRKWPANFKAYKSACNAKQVKTGRMFIYHAAELATPKYIINFPTKNYWGNDSRIEYIQEGLADLIEQVQRLGITSIVLPPLGCGNGGLKWHVVRPLIEKAFSVVPDVEVRLVESDAIKKSPERQSLKMTSGRAAIIATLAVYSQVNHRLTRSIIHNLAFLLQASGEDLHLHFNKSPYGVYSDKLDSALIAMSGHFLHGLPAVSPDAEILLDKIAVVRAESFIAEQQSQQLSQTIARVDRVINGFESSYGLDLLVSVYWAAIHENVFDLPEIIDVMQRGNLSPVMKLSHIEKTWEHLVAQNWIMTDREITNVA